MRRAPRIRRRAPLPSCPNPVSRARSPGRRRSRAMPPIPRASPPPPPTPADTARLAAPLAIAQLSQMAMSVTDTVLLGSLGPDALAAGGLGANLFFVVVTLLQGVLTSVSVSVSHARGAQD